AYKEKALETHPDKGGSNEAFDQVHKAYLTLSQPRSRKRYDETGAVDDDYFVSEGGRLRKLAGEQLLILFGDTILTHDKTGGNVFTIMSQKARRSQVNAENALKGHTKTQEMLGKYRKRVKRKKGEGADFIMAWFDQQEMGVKNQIAITKEEIDIWNKTQSLIEEYEWIESSSEPNIIAKWDITWNLWGKT
ncbi:DnaJ domain-containing protein, partial [Candidatus Pacearchaeota archaeon]|nr:DnaJ domain-containing protein [Candidatus Pacearchaeota archaeon]